MVETILREPQRRARRCIRVIALQQSRDRVPLQHWRYSVKGLQHFVVITSRMIVKELQLTETILWF